MTIRPKTEAISAILRFRSRFAIRGTSKIIGVWINILNWSYFQNILDSVEMDLANLDLRTGYSFLIAKDANTYIGHKYRANRKFDESGRRVGKQDFYGTRLIENYGSDGLHAAILNRARDYAYRLPKGSRKTSGLAPINDTSFGWKVGVEIDQADVFRPIQKIRYWLFGATILLGIAGCAIHLPHRPRHYRTRQDVNTIGLNHCTGKFQRTRAYSFFG